MKMCHAKTYDSLRVSDALGINVHNVADYIEREIQPITDSEQHAARA